MFPNTYNQNTSPNHQPEQYRHPCPHCDRVFVCPHNVQQHCREQHEELGYPKIPCTWPGCNKSFARNFALYRHTEAVHDWDIRPGRGRRGEHGVYMQPARSGQHAGMHPGGQSGAPTGRGNSGGRRRETVGGSNGGRRGQPGRRGRRGVGPRGPVRVRPEDQEQKPWTIRIIEAEPEMTDDGAEFDYDFDTAACAEQVSESPSEAEAAGPRFRCEVINCALCFETFNDREDLLGHLHLSHGLPYSEHCDCLVCSAMKISGMPFHEDVSLKQNPELTQAQAEAGAPETERHDSVCGDAAMDIEADSDIQDSSTNLTLVDQTPVGGGEPAELGTQQFEDDTDLNIFDAGFLGAEYDQTYFDYLDKDLSA